MIKTRVSLRRLIGRLKKMAEILAQYGAMALPLAVVILIFGRDAGGATFALFIFLSLILIWIGWKSFDMAVKRSNQDVYERREEMGKRWDRDKVMIALLTAIAEKQGVDTKALLGKGDK